MSLPRIDNSNLWDKTYSILKEQIIRREFGANEKLSIPKLAEQLGISRTPIRDALNRLEMDGLVKTISKVGTFVSAIDEKTILDIMDTRLMLEFWVIEKIPQLPKADIKEGLNRMKRVLDETSGRIQSEDFHSDTYADLNLEFHLEFIKIGQNEKNVDIYNKLMSYRYLAAKSSLISKEMVLTAMEQHNAIVQTIKEGNQDDIRKEIELHLEDSRNRLVTKIKNNGGSI